MSELPKQSLKRRLVRLASIAMLSTTAATLLTAGWLSAQAERERLDTVRAQLRAGLHNRAASLTRAHAMALRGLVSDNAFRDIEELIHGAVRADADLVYGLFLASDGVPWAYSSPLRRSPSGGPIDAQAALSELALDPKRMGQAAPGSQLKQLFGQPVFESAARVLDEDGELLGTVVYGLSEAGTQRAVREATASSRRTLALILGLTILSGLICVTFGLTALLRWSTRIIRPLAELTHAAQSIRTGKVGVRVDIRTGDEVETLAAAFNEMQDSREQAMRDLEVKTEAALAADRHKSEFLANMSHEIRTPINGLLGMLRLMRRQTLVEPLVRYVETMDASSRALLTIVNDILDFSKLESGKYQLHVVPFDLRIVVQDACELASARSRDKGVELICRIDPKLPKQLVGDPDRLRQVLNNLLSNATKFTDQGEVYVDIQLRDMSGESALVGMTVEDTGPGIAADQLERVWESFAQADGSAARQYGGTGLGLAISRQLVALMGGKTSLSSQPGVGSTFRFEVPLGVHQNDVSPPSYSPPSRERWVLLIEKNRRLRAVVEEHLSSWQLACRSVETAKQAAQALRSPPAEAGFCALIAGTTVEALPELLRTVREDPRGSQLAVVLYGDTPSEADGGPLQKVRARLQKPLRFSELYNSLHGLGPVSQAVRSRPHSEPGGKEAGRVLIVDDNDINRLVAVEELSYRSYVAETATNGQEALEKFMGGRFDCILMDCQMPVMDGYEATRQIRRYERERGLKPTPVVALTAHALVGEREKVMAAGMDDIVSKPFRPSLLMKILRSHVSASQPVLQEVVAPEGVLQEGATRSPKLIELFFSRMPLDLEALNEAVEEQTADGVGARAHKIKGSCLAFAAPRMASTARALEEGAKSGDLSQSVALLKRLRADYDDVVHAMK